MLDKSAVDQMVRDAQEHAEEDRQRREEVETRNQAEALAFQAERVLKDLGDKVPSEDKLEVENQVASLREALKGSDMDIVKTGMTALAETLNRIGAAAYQAAAADSSSTASRRRRVGSRRSRSPSTSMPTGSSTSRPRTGRPARSSRSASRPRRCSTRAPWTRWSAMPRSTPRKTASGARKSRPATRRRPSPSRPSGPSRTSATRSRPRTSSRPRTRSRPCARPSRAPTSRRSRPG